MQRELLSIEQLAEYLGVQVSTITNWRARGKGPKALPTPPGTALVRYRASEVEAWLEGEMTK